MSVCPGMSMLLTSFQFVIVIGSFTEESQLYCIVLYCGAGSMGTGKVSVCQAVRTHEL